MILRVIIMTRFLDRQQQLMMWTNPGHQGMYHPHFSIHHLCFHPLHVGKDLTLIRSCESKQRYLKPTARNYCLSQSFRAQFPDQFKPFFSLPFGVEESLINSSYNDSNPHLTVPL